MPYSDSPSPQQSPESLLGRPGSDKRVVGYKPAGAQAQIRVPGDDPESTRDHRFWAISVLCWLYFSVTDNDAYVLLGA